MAPGGFLQLAVTLAILTSGLGFNVDIGNHVTHFGDQVGSMFGFAVAQHKDQGQSRLLVGAPRYSTEQQRSRGVQRAGAVLECSPTVPSRCIEVPFDTSGNNVHPLGQQLDSKSDQWFGATLRSSGEDGVVVACAPRYVWFTESLKRREPVGACYVARQALKDFQEFSPCRTRQWGYHRQGSCQAGFSAVITQDGEKMFLGAPGAFYWQGQVHSHDLQNRNEYFMTGEGPATDDDQYSGYSSAVGNFSGRGRRDVALGVPKGLNYTGKISLYSENLTPLQNITGYQLGSYFGYCLAVMDFNNDGLDDIIVGAPMYTDYEDREMRFEVGRVHVIMQNKVHRFRQTVTYTGEISRGRFGLSLTSLGDINMDGIQDFAVGAPYGGLDGNGAVFIYHGFEIRRGELISEELKKPTQIIYASDVSIGRSVSTFGWSLSGGMDMDNNEYPDLMVGAYLADAAVLLKSRPIVTLVNHSLTFMSESKTIDLEAVDSEVNPCLNSNSRPVTCVDLRFCIGYGGVGVSDQIELDVQVILDGKVNEPRLFFLENEQTTLNERLSLRKDSSQNCNVYKVYVAPSLTDKLSPMSAEVNMTLVEQSSYRRITRSLTPVLNQRQKLKLSDAITIQKNCGPDNVCIPDLVLTFNAPETFIFRKKEQLEVDIRVENNKEDAFEARVYLFVPQGLLYNIFEAKDNTSVICSPRTQGQNTTVICDIGNPLSTHKGVHFTILLQQKSGTLEEPLLEFVVIANSTNSEEGYTQEDNIIRSTVMVDVDTELTLYGSSSPENIEYNRTLYRSSGYTHEEHMGPEVIHVYGLSNNGDSPILGTEFVILWPTQTLSENYLLYLLEQPYISGNAKCDYIPDVNPLGLQLNEESLSIRILRLNGQVEGGSLASGGGGVASSSGVVVGEGEVESEGGIHTESGRGGSGYYEESESTYYSSSGDKEGNYSYTSSSSSSSTFSRSSSSSSSSKGSSSSSSSSRSGQNDLVRTRRQLDGTSWENEITSCGASLCTRIRCEAGQLNEADVVHIYVRSRVVLTTLAEDPHMYPFDEVNITSKMVARITSLPHSINPEILPLKTMKVATPAGPAKSLHDSPQVPWWVILLAILAGILILFVIILILWKCGYFKRNRPVEHQAKQDEAAHPLNPPPAYNNGYNHKIYPGDQAL